MLSYRRKHLQRLWERVARAGSAILIACVMVLVVLFIPIGIAIASTMPFAFAQSEIESLARCELIQTQLSWEYQSGCGHNSPIVWAILGFPPGWGMLYVLLHLSLSGGLDQEMENKTISAIATVGATAIVLILSYIFLWEREVYAELPLLVLGLWWSGFLIITGLISFSVQVVWKWWKSRA